MVYRPGSPYAYLQHEADATPDPSIAPGHSGYFSAPQSTLDPHLFDGQTVKQEVRASVLYTLLTYWHSRYQRPELWSTVWLAGSGISYQWAGDRGNGDLDVLVGIDFPLFYQHNEQFRGLSEDDVAKYIDDDLKANLWPKTANTNFNGQTYEVTYFVNDNATDIRNIHPYAAYDLTHDRWTVKPPALPHDPKTLYPEVFWATFERERAEAQRLVDEYHTLHGAVDGQRPSTPGWVNAASRLARVAAQARALFDDIHTGRRAAFAPGGSGYGDWANFRWQAHKQAGTVEALHEIASVDAGARDALQTAQYGSVVLPASQALSQAVLARR